MAQTVLHIAKVEILLTGLTEPLIDKAAIQPTVQMAQPIAVVEIQPTGLTEPLVGKLATLLTATESRTPNTAVKRFCTSNPYQFSASSYHFGSNFSACYAVIWVRSYEGTAVALQP